MTMQKLPRAAHQCLRARACAPWICSCTRQAHIVTTARAPTCACAPVPTMMSRYWRPDAVVTISLASMSATHAASHITRVSSSWGRLAAAAGAGAAAGLVVC